MKIRAKTEFVKRPSFTHEHEEFILRTIKMLKIKIETNCFSRPIIPHLCLKIEKKKFVFFLLLGGGLRQGEFLPTLRFCIKYIRVYE